MKDVICLIFVTLIVTVVFGQAAWLIYKQADGWGWFLLCAVIVLSGLKLEVS